MIVMDIILASLSPRRKELLQKITTDFKVIPSTADETLPTGISPSDAVEFLSEKKAKEIFMQNPNCCVIGSDTVVAINGEILGKPDNVAQAVEMLQKLSGATHHVYTGVTVITPQGKLTTCSKTEVCFYQISSKGIENYVATGEPMDKAGAYGIQDHGALLVKSMTGDYYSVMGLPVSSLYHMLLDLKVIPPVFL